MLSEWDPYSDKDHGASLDVVRMDAYSDKIHYSTYDVVLIAPDSDITITISPSSV